MQLIKASGSVTPSALVMGTKDAATNKADSFAQKIPLDAFIADFSWEQMTPEIFHFELQNWIYTYNQ